MTYYSIRNRRTITSANNFPNQENNNCCKVANIIHTFQQNSIINFKKKIAQNRDVPNVSVNPPIFNNIYKEDFFNVLFSTLFHRTPTTHATAILLAYCVFFPFSYFSALSVFVIYDAASEA